MTLDGLRQLADDLRCDVTRCRCRDYGCAHPGATILPDDWRCPACAVYDAIQGLRTGVVTATTATLSPPVVVFLPPALPGEPAPDEDSPDYADALDALDASLEAMADRLLRASMARSVLKG